MDTQTLIHPDDFTAYYAAVYGYQPFRWQRRLAARACDGDWPRYLKLPTASGKTSCIDIALFALAFQACRQALHGTAIDMPRRIFFVVDRRIIVNEAFQRAARLRDALAKALTPTGTPPPLTAVAQWLQTLGGDGPPLDCFELRGGIYRDDAWVRSPLQPTVLTSTVDQVGSRLLFRGYGVSDRSLPIHAALTANDAMIILDEAHCSNPFSQTLNAIASYRDLTQAEDEMPRWAEAPLNTPFRLVEMTATPPAQYTGALFTLEAQDYTDDAPLQHRHGCTKPVHLKRVKAAGAQQNRRLAREMVEAAQSLARASGDTPRRKIAIVVNRVDCAREAYALLQRHHGDRVRLMIGRMRPLDRDRLTEELQTLFGTGAQATLDEPHFVVATQCIEVGADLDFDGMVCQCASLDALRQRFGRLNRLGHAAHARGTVIMADGDLQPKRPDPIYADALPATWEWLQQQAPDGSIDFGIHAMEARLQSMDGAAQADLNITPAHAPVLLPAHLDVLCQTGPRPQYEPDIAAFLHGPGRGIPDVQICWRADLAPPTAPGELNDWAQDCTLAVTVCPPTSAECMPVPLPLFRRWLEGNATDDPSGDTLGAVNTDSAAKGGEQPLQGNRAALLWRGGTCYALSTHLPQSLEHISPQATVILPAAAGGWHAFGHIPQAEDSDTATDGIDIASEAFRQSRGRPILRLHDALIGSQAERAALRGLTDFIHEQNLPWRHSVLAKPDETASVAIAESLTPSAARKANALAALRQELFTAPAQQVHMVRYPGGFAVTGPRVQRRLPRENFDDERDEQNVDADQPLTLAGHLADVATETRRFGGALHLPGELVEILARSAECHDLGKADPRFQAMLLDAPLEIACMQPHLLAKSARGVHTQAPRSKLPAGWRHEMLSVELAQQLSHRCTTEHEPLLLHCIAAHHGYARPFAPVVIDHTPSTVTLHKLKGGEWDNAHLTITAQQRRQRAPLHRLDSGIGDRFWSLNRKYGWWGLAWLETVLRLADWSASAMPNRGDHEISLEPRPLDTTTTITRNYELPLVGLDGTNPLGFLAALGTLRTANTALPNHRISMYWKHSGLWRPVLKSVEKLSEDTLVASLYAALKDCKDAPQFTALGDNINVSKAVFRQAARQAVNDARLGSRTFADFCAAYGSDALSPPNEPQKIQDSALRTMAGAGHQHFLKTMRALIATLTEEHLQKTLFTAWAYADPAEALSLRFDPADDIRYALRWRDPSGDPRRKYAGSNHGANRLAIEALPLLPSLPGATRLHTTAFMGHRSDNTYFLWPIWAHPISATLLPSLLSLTDIYAANRYLSQLSQRGITSVMGSQRITVGKVRNFAPSEPIAILPLDPAA